MKILIAGGSGFIGQHLIRTLQRSTNNSITILSRNKPKKKSSCKYALWTDPQLPKLIGEQDVIINLCGESVMDRRWSEKRKKSLETSRVQTTLRLVKMINLSPNSQTLIQASGIGYYGTSGDAFLDESSKQGKDYLAQLCYRWENELKKLNKKNRSVTLRIGLVLANNGGALPRMLTPLRLGLGGPLASGLQWVSWIHVKDLTFMILSIIKNSSFTGVINGTAPTPCTNYTLTKSVAKQLHRPSFFKVPARLLKLLLGERAILLNEGQRVISKRTSEMNFKFRYPFIDTALENILKHE
ncbi:TIGR01777 family protein [PVC group bacterium (ex Bugula neritina AB1)]|nr:TIGR01777 family protein [PVC group bacterium (ex Bugula neritina AB1)]